MTRHLRIALALGAALLPLGACSSAQAPSATVAPAADQHEDATFLRQAPVYGLDAVTFAKSAQAKASDPAVRAFAATVSQHYTTIDQQLAPLAKRYGMEPVEMDSEHQVVFHQLEALNGRMFDAAYIHRSQQDLTMTIQLCQAETDSGKLPELQAVARDNLPVLIEDLRTATELAQGR